MGKIMYKGKSYSGSGTSSSNKSEDIVYNNTNSGLDSTNVQSAIDELNTKLSDNTVTQNPQVQFITWEEND